MSEVTQDIANEVGGRLADARTESGKSRKAAATEMRVTTHLVESMEEGQWDRLGAEVYARGYLRAYGRLLGVSTEEADAYFSRPAPVVPAEDVVRRPRGDVSGSIARYSRYVVATALIAIPLGMALTRAFQGESPAGAEEEPAHLAASLTPVVQKTGSQNESITPNSGFEGASAAIDPQPEVLAVANTSASVLPTSEDELATSPAGAVDGYYLKLALNEDAWVEARDARGERLVFGIQRAGSTIRLDISAGIEARIGNAHAIEATLNDQPYDLTPYMVGDVASVQIQPPTSD